jgi:outer membrane protein
MKRAIFISLFFLGFFSFQSFAGGKDSVKVSLSLKNVVDLAIRESASIKYVQNTNVNYFWRWKNFRR